MTNPFQRATKEQGKARIAFIGPSGSGKTYSALRVATRLAEHEDGRVAYIDTEHGSASKYADTFDFDTVLMEPPYEPERYVKMMDAAAAAGYAVIVIDSLSHEWDGTGGILEIVDAAKKRFGGNTHYAWAEGTPRHKKLIEALVSSPCHVVGCMRSKSDYVVVEENGKKTPRKVGLAPIQREGMEFEFDVIGNIDLEHTYVIEKTRCPALDKKVFDHPGEDLADILYNWLSEGDPNPEYEPITDDQMERISELAAEREIPDGKALELLGEHLDGEGLSQARAERAIAWLEDLPEKAEGE